MLSFLGIGGAFNVNLKNCSAFYKANKKLILIDCGESIFEEILNKNILDDIEDLTIIITHFHSDHVGSLGSLIFYSDKINIKNVNIIYPNKKAMNDLLKIYGVTDCNYKVYNPSEYNNFFIKQYLQDHSFIEAYGYLLEFNNKRIYYSGDTKSIPEEILKEFLTGKISYFYQDVRVEENNYHLSLNKLEKYIPIEHRKEVNCMHFNTQEEMDIIKDRGFSLVKKVR